MNRVALLVRQLAPAVLCAACGGGADIPGLPVADAGFDRRGVQIGTVVTLDGSGSSDPDGGTLAFDWQLVSRPDESITVLAVGADPTRPSLQPDLPGTYLVSLQVANAERSSRVDVVAIEAANEGPTAVAQCECPAGGIPSCALGTCPGLHGTAVRLIDDSSDPEADALTFNWSQVTTLATCQAACGPGFGSCAPSGPGETLGSTVISLTNRQQPTATVVLPPTRDVHYVFALEVSDGFASDTACAAYVTTNTAPSFFAPARQSQDNYSQAEAVGFDVECSPNADPDGDSIDILWRQLAPPAPSAILGSPTSQQTSVTVPNGSLSVDTVFFFEVEISDGVDRATQQLPGITVAP